MRCPLWHQLCKPGRRSSPRATSWCSQCGSRARTSASRVSPCACIPPTASSYGWTNLWPGTKVVIWQCLIIMVHMGIILPGKSRIFRCLDHYVYWHKSCGRLTPSRRLIFFRPPGQCSHCLFFLPKPGAPVHQHTKNHICFKNNSMLLLLQPVGNKEARSVFPTS